MARRTKPTNDPVFDQFWSKYPRKVAKTEAFNAWTSLKLTMFDLDAIFTALEWQCAQAQWDNPVFIPHPATYLRGRRWEDERPASPIVATTSLASSRQQYGRRTQGNLSAMQRFLDRNPLVDHVAK
jgi:hypothetical protein